MPTERLWEHASMCVCVCVYVCVCSEVETDYTVLAAAVQGMMSGCYLSTLPCFYFLFSKIKKYDDTYIFFNERLRYILIILLWWSSDKLNKRQRFTWEYSLSGWEQSTSHLSAVSMINGTNKWPSTGCFCIVSCFHLGDCAFVFLRGREGSA